MPTRKRVANAERNRRAFPRWKARFVVRTPGKSFSFESLEISEGGLSFRTTETFKIGQNLDFEFLLEGCDQWIKVKSAVRHAEEGRVGLEFLNLKRADRLKIIDHLAAKA